MANLEIYYWVLKLMKICVHQFLRKQQLRFVITGLMHPAAMLIRIALNFSNPETKEKSEICESGFRILVGVSGFEPEASWTRTKRDTKLRHTPSALIL